LLLLFNFSIGDCACRPNGPDRDPHAYKPIIKTMKHIHPAPLILITMWLAAACGGSATQEGFADCRYGEPEPIFNESIPQIQSHDFELNKRKGIEEIDFTSGEELTIIQSGCDTIRQDFQFRLPGDYRDKTDMFWITKTVQEFQRLGDLGPEYLAFASWSQAISEKADAIQLSKSQQIQPGFYVTIEKIVSADHALLIVALSERP